MIYFRDFNIPTNVTIGITHLLSNITTRPDSHKGGWTRLLKCQLNHCGYPNVKILDNKDSLNDFQYIIFDLGAEFSGSLNMFGGLDEKTFKRLQELEQFQGEFLSWRNDLPDISVLEARRNNASTCEDFKTTNGDFIPRVCEKLKMVRKFDHAYKTNRLLISDSHGPSVWDPSFIIERRDGRTLQGLLDNHTIPKYLNLIPDIDMLQIHCSSIDIRHHVFRESNPEEHIAFMAQRLLDQSQVFQGHKIFTQTMGIEDESRELPKTGYFKGTAFCGTWEQRNLARTIFNEVIELGATEISAHHSLASVQALPDFFFDETGKLKFDVMEKPGSVHTSPAFYRTNLDTGDSRW